MPITACSLIMIYWDAGVKLRGADDVDRQLILAATAALKNTIPLIEVPIPLTLKRFWTVP